MMTFAEVIDLGIRMTFADGSGGLIPCVELRGVSGVEAIEALSLPNPYMLVLALTDGSEIEIPWDFARHYCNPTYRQRVEAIADRGKKSLGERIRNMRRASEATQAALASGAGIGRITLSRIERGEQAPRYATLAAIAASLGTSIGSLSADENSEAPVR